MQGDSVRDIFNFYGFGSYIRLIDRSKVTATLFFKDVTCLQLQLQLQYFIVSSQYIYETLTISDISFIQTLIRKREKERKKESKKERKKER